MKKKTTTIVQPRIERFIKLVKNYLITSYLEDNWKQWELRAFVLELNKGKPIPNAGISVN